MPEITDIWSVPLEAMFTSLAWHLGGTLGGTITGYGVVAPAVLHG